MSKFTKLTTLKAIIRQVACGDYHTLALTKEGAVYTWGGSLHKKAQGGHEPKIVQALIDLQASVIQVDCGDCHSVALDHNGRVFTWGGGGSAYNKG